MKKSFLLVLLTILASCSTTKVEAPKEEARAVASKDYECTFNEMVAGDKAEFIFSPDNLKLEVRSQKFGSETLYLEEDDFVTGGFTYVQDASKMRSAWPVKRIEFISFTNSPKVTVEFKRTPASVKPLVVSKKCN